MDLLDLVWHVPAYFAPSQLLLLLHQITHIALSLVIWYGMCLHLFEQSQLLLLLKQGMHISLFCDYISSLCISLSADGSAAAAHIIKL